MRLNPTPLPGLITVEADPHQDARGQFARVFCRDSFLAAGVDFQPVQVNLSTNTLAHTLRGLHYQAGEFAEEKLVRCVAGRVWDVAVDLRPGPTRGTWHAVELDAGRMNGIYIPKGFAHGFLSLTPGAVVQYMMAPAYIPGHGRGIAWDDPDLAITWPARPAVISDADAALPPFASLT
ncbi:dTDP-4-dehydrorhamnose 3,5-epimerase family protein [Paracoccus sp. IB05]|uniref:dTDP-4-dehydrorhamnose 3,5-epimerase family protein n=1 Tax=Paracoccus sp. IB05 TaxID=2779367 RepID=UPI0018E7EB06|nr:dTDP-4-dehydrorhamnose 3,5-epimerase family protein [Paracoccus sp. IB05]MBJ2151157.1 dTDP-4-dehydrorhamnose 3,5-epimerase family protein [Paracoccus sp. IB05]